LGGLQVHSDPQGQRGRSAARVLRRAAQVGVRGREEGQGAGESPRGRIPHVHGVRAMNALVLLLCAALLFLPAACVATEGSPKAPTLRLEMDGGIWSGTAIGPDEVLTAVHCLSNRLVKINDEPVELLESRQIGPDMIVIRVDRRFDSWAKWADRKPEQGDPIY